jgi:glutathione S-transferase
VLTLYQTEWCPYSHVVRQRLTELGINYLAKQVPAERDDRAEQRRATGADRVPILIPHEGPPVEGAEEILRYLCERFEEPPDAELHRAKAQEHVPRFPEVNRAHRRGSRIGAVSCEAAFSEARAMR